MNKQFAEEFADRMHMFSSSSKVYTVLTKGMKNEIRVKIPAFFRVLLVHRSEM
jgi:hypothetical protein